MRGRGKVVQGRWLCNRASSTKSPEKFIWRKNWGTQNQLRSEGWGPEVLAAKEVRWALFRPRQVRIQLPPGSGHTRSCQAAPPLSRGGRQRRSAAQYMCSVGLSAAAAASGGSTAATCGPAQQQHLLVSTRPQRQLPPPVGAPEAPRSSEPLCQLALSMFRRGGSA